MFNDPREVEQESAAVAKTTAHTPPGPKYRGIVRSTVEKFKTDGSLIIPDILCPLSEEDWTRLDRLTEELPHSRRSAYDIATILDWEAPRGEFAARASNAEILDLAASPATMRIFKALTGRPNLVPSQSHSLILKQGDRTGYHSHDAVALTAVFHFPNNCEGGVYQDTAEYSGEVREHFPPPYSIFVSKGHIYHEVTEVTKGRRKTLVVFFN